MNYLPFKWSGPVSLVDELTKPFVKVSVWIDPHGSPTTITLWRLDGTGLKIYSEMHDVAERTEVGVLNISFVSAPSESETVLILGSEYHGEKRAFKATSKLIIEESGTTAETGLVFSSPGNLEFLIVAAAFPCNIAIQGKFSLPGSEPEYPLEQYKRVALMKPQLTPSA